MQTQLAVARKASSKVRKEAKAEKENLSEEYLNEMKKLLLHDGCCCL